MTRVPATLHAAQAALAQAHPQSMAPLTAGSRDHVLPATEGGVQPRWRRIASAHRYAQAQRTVDKPLRKHREQDVKEFKPRCRTTVACEADAHQALTTCRHRVQATFLHTVTVCATPRDGTRGRPRPDTPPAPVVYRIEGALASALTTRQALSDPHRCVILATKARDEATLPPQEVLNGYPGQTQTARGFRVLKDPQFLASSRYLKRPERIMALLMVMTVCVLVSAALAYRIRKALHDHDATFPNHTGQPVQNPTARWVYQSCMLLEA
jgi:transposase